MMTILGQTGSTDPEPVIAMMSPRTRLGAPWAQSMVATRTKLGVRALWLAKYARRMPRAQTQARHANFLLLWILATARALLLRALLSLATVPIRGVRLCCLSRKTLTTVGPSACHATRLARHVPQGSTSARGMRIRSTPASETAAPTLQIQVGCPTSRTATSTLAATICSLSRCARNAVYASSGPAPRPLTRPRARAPGPALPAFTQRRTRAAAALRTPRLRPPPPHTRRLLVKDPSTRLQGQSFSRGRRACQSTVRARWSAGPYWWTRSRSARGATSSSSPGS